MEFFIINDAIFSKLCILGDDVEPCFEGSAVTAPQVSASFTVDDNFKHTLFEMMQELTYALKGGNKVADIKDKVSEVQPEENFVETQDNGDQSLFEEKDNTTEGAESTFEQNEEVLNTFEKQDDKEEKEEEASEDSKEDEEDTSASDDEDDKKKYSLLEEQYNNLQKDFAALEEEVKNLRSFKLEVESKEKDNLISQFYMLSDEDKKDVIENKDKYSLEEIESKLAVICFKKRVNFNLEDSKENEESKENEIVTTFNVDNKEDSTPDWIKAVESTMNNII